MDRVLRRLSTSLAPVLGAVKLDMRGEKGLAVLGDEDLLVILLYNLCTMPKRQPQRTAWCMCCARARPAAVCFLCVRDTAAASEGRAVPRDRAVLYGG